MPKEVLCKYCKTPTENTGTMMCDFCWEVDHRLEGFLRWSPARIRVLELMVKALQDVT